MKIKHRAYIIIPANEKGKNITLDLTPEPSFDSFSAQWEDVKKEVLTNRSYDQLIRDAFTKSNED
jgi:hypothetical protein